MCAASNQSRLRLYLPTLPIVALAFLPVVVLVVLASGEPLSFGTRNWRIFGNTVALTALTVGGAVLIGVPLAFATTCLRLRGSGVALAALAAPLAVPSYIGAFAYFAATGRGGELESILGFAPPEVRGLFGTACFFVFRRLRQ